MAVLVVVCSSLRPELGNQYTEYRVDSLQPVSPQVTGEDPGAVAAAAWVAAIGKVLAP